MKKIYFPLLLVLIFFLGCQKDPLQEIEDSALVLTVSQAQEWFEANPTPIQKKKGSPNSKKVYPAVQPRWQEATTAEDARYFLVEVPVDADTRLAFKMKGHETTPNGVTKLLVLKDKEKGRMVSALMHAFSLDGVEPATFNYRKIPKGFSGLVFYTSLEGDFVNGYTYEGGKIAMTLRKPMKSSTACTYCNTFGFVEIWERTCTVRADGSDFCTAAYFVRNEPVAQCPPAIDQLSEEGGGTSGSGGGYAEPETIVQDIYVPEPEFIEVILCPKTFNFHSNATTNWQAAGVVNYRLTVVDINAGLPKYNTIFFTFEVGMPKTSDISGMVTSQRAQEYATIAANKAEKYIGTNHGPDFFQAGAQSIYAQIFANKMETYLNELLGGNVGKVNMGLNFLNSGQASSPVFFGWGGCD